MIPINYLFIPNRKRNQNNKQSKPNQNQTNIIYNIFLFFFNKLNQII